MSSVLMMGDASVQPPVPGLTIVGIDTKFGNAANVHTLTGVPAGALLVVATAGQFQQTDATVTSSPSLTWTKKADATTPQSPNAEIWTATYTAGGSITVTSDFGAGRVQTSVCYTMTGQDTTDGQGAVGLGQDTGNVNVTTGRTNSIIVCVSFNWNAPDGGAGGTTTQYRNGQATATQTLYYRDPANGTFWHYTYPAQNIQPYTVGYSSPPDPDGALGTSTAVLEVRSLTGSGPTPDTTNPVMSNVTVGTVTHNTANLSWPPATDNVGVTGYAVLVGTTNPPTATVANITATSYQITGLIPETTYYVIVRARDAAGNTNDSTVDSFTTGATPVDTTPPSAPTNLAISNLLPTSATLTWTISTDNVAVQDYLIYRGTVNPPTTSIGTVTHPTNTFNLTGLSPVTTYFVRVQARDTSLNTTFSTVLQFTTPNTIDTTPPVWTGTVLTLGTITSNTVQLNWTAATDNVGVTAYEIFQGNPTGASIGSVSGATLTFTVTSLSPATAYIFYVRAKDAAGNGTNSNTVNPTTTGVTTCSGGNGIQVNFTALAVDYSRYWGGSEKWNENDLSNCKAVRNVPLPMHYYRRFSWVDIEPTTQGVYDWTKFDQKVQEAVNNRQLFSFGIMTVFTEIANAGGFNDCITGVTGISEKTHASATATLAYPTYLHNLMQGETVKDWVVGGTFKDWIPNFNSSFYINRLGALYQAIVAHLAATSYSGFIGTSVIGYVDLRGMGNYGEWHSNGIVASNTSEYPAGTFPTSASLKSIVDAHRNNITLWPLCTILNSLDGNFDSGNGFDNTNIPVDVGQYIMDNGNAWGNIGWRRDQWGDISDYYHVVIQTGTTITGISNRWQTAPVVGEPPGYNDPGGSTSVNGVHMAALNLAAGTNGTQVASQHPSMIGNGNYGCPRCPESGVDPNCDCANCTDCGCISGSGTANNMRTAFKAMGAIIRPTTACVILNASNLIITIDWNNFGTNTQHSHWDLFFQLRNSGGTLVWTSPVKSGFDPFHKLPGVVTTIQDTYARPVITAGQTYTLALRFQDPKGYMLPLQLGINGRQDPSGHYNITTLNF